MTKAKERPFHTTEYYLQQYPNDIAKLASLSSEMLPIEIDKVVNEYWHNGIRKSDVLARLKEYRKWKRAEDRLKAQELANKFDERTPITVEGDRLKENIDKIQDKLSRETENMVFQKGGMLMRVYHPPKVEHDSLDQGVVTAEVTPEWLKLRLLETFRFEKQKTDEIEFIDPPSAYCNTLIRMGNWELPVLKGVVETPTLLLNGDMVDNPGYHRPSGLFYDPRSAVFLPVPDKPTRKDAQEALQFLLNPFRAFPFETDASMAIVPAGILTMMARRDLDKAPIFAMDAQVMGSGKTKLVDCTGLITIGRPLQPTPYSADQAELRKQLQSTMLLGPAGILFDNIVVPLQSPDIAAAITSEYIEGRLLGTNKVPRISTNTTIFVTGNNMVIKGDLERRSLKCRIVPDVERPYERKFNFSPEHEIMSHRDKFVLAALTILKAYYVAGFPDQNLAAFNVGTFDMWNNSVRSALVWAGSADPCGDHRDLIDDNPDVEILGQVLIALKTKYKNTEFTTSGVMGIVEKVKAGDNGAENTNLVNKMKLINKEPNSDNLGKFFRDNADRRCDGLHLKKGGRKWGARLWSVLGEVKGDK